MKWQEIGAELPNGGNYLTRQLGRLMLRAIGWRLDGELPNQPKMIIAVAPHSSNIDFLLTVCVIWGLGIRASYLAKSSLFAFPLGLMMRAFGGIPVDRDSPHGLVGQMAKHFESTPQLILGITPEGTRSAVARWKRGFALIAESANIPVVPAILNYDTRTVSFRPAMLDVSDADRTLRYVQDAAVTHGSARR